MSQTATRRITRKPPIIDEPDESLVELVARLGNVPLHRILQLPPPGTATEADVLKAAAKPRKRLCELIDGVLVEKPMGFPESILASEIGYRLKHHVKTNRLGLVSTTDGMLRLWPGRVRIPDVAFFAGERLPGKRVPKKQIPELVPDIAIEVLSPSNTPEEIKAKRLDYFKSGTQLVWIFDPETRTVDVYKSANSKKRLTENDTIDGNNVLPGFRMPLAELFAELDQQW